MSSISSAYQRGDVFGFLEFLPPELLDLILNSLPPAEWHSGTLVLGWQALGFKHRRSRMYNKHANQGLDIKTGNEAGEPPSAAARLTQFREWLNKSLSTPAGWKYVKSLELEFQVYTVTSVDWNGVAQCINEHSMRLPRMAITYNLSAPGYIDTHGRSQLADFIVALMKRPYAMDLKLNLDELADADVDILVDLATFPSEVEICDHALRHKWTTVRDVYFIRGQDSGLSSMNEREPLRPSIEAFPARLTQARKDADRHQAFLEKCNFAFMPQEMLDQAADTLGQLHSETLTSLNVIDADLRAELRMLTLLKLVRSVERWPALREFIVYIEHGQSGQYANDITLEVVKRCPGLETLCIQSCMIKLETMFKVLTELRYMNNLNLVFDESSETTADNIKEMLERAGRVIKQQQAEMQQQQQQTEVQQQQQQQKQGSTDSVKPYQRLSQIVLELPMSIGPDGVSAIKSTILEHLPATRVRVHSRS